MFNVLMHEVLSSFITWITVTWKMTVVNPYMCIYLVKTIQLNKGWIKKS